MYPAARSLLFRLDPEQAHSLTLWLLRLAGRLPPSARLLRALFRTPELPVTVFGLQFANPVGLAAGYDKDGLAWRGLARLGFGHIEVGTITPRPQAGNPRPRLFRLPQEQALINRMGFPGRGAAFAAAQLSSQRPQGLVLGANLGKNKDTPIEQAAEDYTALVPIFAPLVDYLAVNVSSPNTVGLRRLQGRDLLHQLLERLALARQEQVKRLGRQVPLLVKLSPDLEPGELEDALDVLLQTGMDGVIATNTSIKRDGLVSPLAAQAGGLSGAPLGEHSTQVIASIYRQVGDRLPVIGVGGIMDADSARRKLEAGAKLVQVYSGLVYRGPGLVKEIVCGLTESGYRG